MPGLLDIPLELRNHVYEYLLAQDFIPQPRGVICLNERYIKSYFPPQCYRGLLHVCRQTYHEFKAAIQHEADANRLHYELTVEFNHGRPYYSLTWIRFPGLSPTINSLTINVDLHLREPYGDGSEPGNADFMKLLEQPGRANFAERLLDSHLPVLLSTLSGLLHDGLMKERVLYVENLTINLKWPTQYAGTIGSSLVNPRGREYQVTSGRVRVGEKEAKELDITMRRSLSLTVADFGAHVVVLEHRAPEKLVQIGCLRLATEGDVWATGNNLDLRDDKFGWLRY
ncbi:hypothetical protein BDV96DRAFT_491960 [Lophiotrema nucula]|uniref:F-box domain-containing protein n=1 Tax=Lophiotrema nucula TaxID=690887 RepID=A0A6A5ZCJ5_9PLEO|nr:hypothetical protein BDV96DRAFT_491960 [Lophiotrema nucula]